MTIEVYPNVDIPPGLHIADGDTEWSDIHKFGRNSAVGTSFVPVAIGGIYQTPQAAAATTLRVKSGGNANDTAAGSGARTIYLEGLDATGAAVSETISTNGSSASSATSSSFVRLYRAYVATSGTYATSSAGSHSADIVIENSGGGTDWATITSTDFPRGQSEIGVYTIPLGKEAYLHSAVISTDSSKSTDIILFKREGILDSAAPYSAMRVLFEGGGLAGTENLAPQTPMGPFPALTDIGFMAKVSTGTGEVDVDFELILRNV